MTARGRAAACAKGRRKDGMLVNVKRNIPFSPPDISQAEIDEVADALRSGWITTGPKTKQFERDLAKFSHTTRFACFNSATAALECALRSLGIGPGDEVITSAYTYTASASPIVHVGATPVLCDVAHGSFEIDYDQVASLVTEKTRAVIPVDVAGVMCDYDRLRAALESVSGKWRPRTPREELFDRVPIVADGAHSLGAVRHGLHSGQAADLTTFSFHAVKNLTTAEGGALTWRDIPGLDSEELYRDLMLMSLHGQTKDALAKTRVGAWEYDVAFCGWKCNMTDLQAALGLAQLRRYPGLLARRRELADLPFSLIKHYGDDFASSGHLMLARIEGASQEFRNAFINEMGEEGVACNVHYKPLPLLTAYKDLGFDIADFPNALAQFSNEVTLPLHTKLSDDDVDYVIAMCHDVFARLSAKGVR